MAAKTNSVHGVKSLKDAPGQSLLLWIGVLLLVIGIWNIYRGETSSSAGDSNVGICSDSTIDIDVNRKFPAGAMQQSEDCFSKGTLFVPWRSRYSITGETEVCFWLNNKCVEIQKISSGDNLDWSASRLEYNAMKFRGKSGTRVLVQLTGHR